jgi:hypothetical protein
VEVQLNRRGFVVPVRRRWVGVAIAVMTALVLGSAAGIVGRHYLHTTKAAQPLPGVNAVQPQPLPSAAQVVEASPAPPPPDHVLLQVPFTTQAPLNNWAQHQESCEAATLSMLISYWGHSSAVVLDPKVADGMINQIDSWKPQPDLTDKMMGELAQQHWGYAYEIVANDPKVIDAPRGRKATHRRSAHACTRQLTLSRLQQPLRAAGLVGPALCADHRLRQHRCLSK